VEVNFIIINEYGGSLRVNEYWDGQYQQNWGHYFKVSEAVKDIKELSVDPIFSGMDIRISYGN
jgi:hypothetical protein